MNSITKFCEKPTITNWNKISQINKNTMFGIAVHCLNSNIGNKNIAKKIVSYKKSHLQKPINLMEVYKTTQSRVNLSNLIKQHLSSINNKASGDWCLEGKNSKLLEKIVLTQKLLGNYFGTTYSASFRHDNLYKFAVRLSSVSEHLIINGKIRKNRNLHGMEYLYLNELIKPLVVNGVCPNLPLLYDTFTCNDCLFSSGRIKNGEQLVEPEEHRNCLIFLTELSTYGTMKNWIKKYNRNPSENQMFSALFQIMAGIHTIQTKLQLINRRIDRDNILVHKVKPGGYWEYVVYGKKYYVPNYGELFVIKEFNASRYYSPYTDREDRVEPIEGYDFDELLNTSLGQRVIVRIRDNKPLSPIELIPSTTVDTKLNINTNKIHDNLLLTQNQKDYLKQKNITTDINSKNFYNHPDIVPPIRFIIDTQDCISMFTGGARVSSWGVPFHKDMPITKKMKGLLREYSLGIDYMSEGRPEEILAGYFIQEFFSIHKDYTKKPKGKIIQTFNIS